MDQHDRKGAVDQQHDLARQGLRHSEPAIASILTAVARGLNQSITDGLLVEAEQFARMASTADLREGLDAWIERREPRYGGAWAHIARPEETRRASLASDQGATTKRPFMLG